MEKSLAPGTISFHLRSQVETRAVLQALCNASPLHDLISVFGADASLHLVGGTVRDVFLGKEISDFDLATKLSPAECATRLKGQHIKVIETGLQHGTITAVIDHHNIEITTFRQKGIHSSSAYSQSIEEDLHARDFTINAIAFSVSEQKLLDPCAGIADLAAGVLRAVGDALARFREDPLRVLRCIRFGPAEGRQVEDRTKLAAKALASHLREVSVERIQMELRKILVNPYAAAAIRMMHDIGILEIILPEIIPSIGFEQNEFHTEDVFDHTLSVLSACPPEALLRWSALFHDIGKPATLSVDENGRRHFYLHEVKSTTICDTVMKRLRCSNEERESVCTIVRHHMRPIECGPPGVRRILRDLGPLFEKWREFKQADAPPVMDREEFRQRLASFDALVQAERDRLAGQEFRLAINGHDLMTLGFREGLLLGQALKTLEEMVMENPDLNTRDVLLEKAQALSKSALN